MADNLWISTQRQPAADTPGPYARLQAWYLANLRTEATKLIQQQMRLLTPLARIDTDRQLLERMVLEATVREAIPAVTARKNLAMQIGWVALVIVITASMIASNMPIPTLFLFVSVCATGFFVHWQTVRSTEKARLDGISTFWTVLQGYGIDLPPLKSVEKQFEKQFAQALLESRLRELAIADYAPELIFAFDDSLKIVCTNVSCIQTLGFEPGELVGQSLDNILLRPKPDVLRAALLKSKDASEPGLTTLVTAISANGDLIDLDVRCEWSNRQQLFFAAAADITSIKKMERARSDFIAMISHDVSRPLQNLLFTLESIKTGAHGRIDPEASEAVTRVEQNVKSVINLVSELMDFERSMEADLHLNKIEFDMGELIDQCCEQVADLAVARSITLENNAESVPVLADRGRLSRVILNLLLNALKFSPPGSQITITTKKSVDNVSVHIKDQGPGVPANLAQAIFNRYFKMEATAIDNTSEEMRGAGLGLAICKVFIEAHKGSIGVNSIEGHGSDFWFTIPKALP